MDRSFALPLDPTIPTHAGVQVEWLV